MLGVMGQGLTKTLGHAIPSGVTAKYLVFATEIDRGLFRLRIETVRCRETRAYSQKCGCLVHSNADGADELPKKLNTKKPVDLREVDRLFGL